MHHSIEPSQLQKISDLCVKCGVCLPHCPTYALEPEETESPRGRITLIQGLAHAQLELTERVSKHIGQCLNCGRCEAVCPANVPYTQLLDDSRYHFNIVPKAHKRRRLWLARLLAAPRALAGLAKALTLYQKLTSGKGNSDSNPSLDLAGNHTRITSTFQRISRWLPSPITLAKRPAQNTQPVDAVLFTGCITHQFEYAIVEAARIIAQRLELNLKIEQDGLCCGALFQHVGERQQAQHQAEICRARLIGDHPIASLNTGCGKGLRENLADLGDRYNSQRICDVHSLFAQHENSSMLSDLRATDTRIGLYLPCTTSPQAKHDMLTVLGWLPSLNLTILDKGMGCCGASGDHMLRNPEAAARIGAPIVTQIVKEKLEVLLVPNSGCAWHLRERFSPFSVEVMHPLQWLAAQIPSSD